MNCNTTHYRANSSSVPGDPTGVIVPTAELEAERIADADARRPDTAAERADAWRTLDRLLTRIGDEKREIFVLAEIEQMAVPEIARLLEIKLNTAYSRLRLAREAFEAALAGDAGETIARGES